MCSQKCIQNCYIKVSIQNCSQSQVRLTHLADGGCVVAITIPHAMADGHSASLLVNLLAVEYQAVTQGGATPDNPATPDAPMPSPNDNPASGALKSPNRAPIMLEKPLRPEVAEGQSDATPVKPWLRPLDYNRTRLFPKLYFAATDANSTKPSKCDAMSPGMSGSSSSESGLQHNRASTLQCAQDTLMSVQLQPANPETTSSAIGSNSSSKEAACVSVMVARQPVVAVGPKPVGHDTSETSKQSLSQFLTASASHEGPISHLHPPSADLDTFKGTSSEATSRMGSELEASVTDVSDAPLPAATAPAGDCANTGSAADATAAAFGALQLDSAPLSSSLPPGAAINGLRRPTNASSASEDVDGPNLSRCNVSDCGIGVNSPTINQALTGFKPTGSHKLASPRLAARATGPNMADGANPLVCGSSAAAKAACFKQRDALGINSCALPACPAQLAHSNTSHGCALNPEQQQATQAATAGECLANDCRPATSLHETAACNAMKDAGIEPELCMNPEPASKDRETSLRRLGLLLQAPRQEPSWLQVVKTAMHMWNKSLKEDRRRFPRTIVDLTTLTLHLPQQQVSAQLVMPSTRA